MTNDKEPFQVVLIDLEKACNGELVCVKKPLTEELKYAAISYRWGELQETVIDTRVGYLASITSFDIQDFYDLCFSMEKSAFDSIDYIWVDAICVNQSNHDERKETIYHMSEIYEHATWIIAVPDLHAKHLKAMHLDVMVSIRKYRHYLSHLVHGNINELCKMDQEFLDSIDVPQDVSLRQLLTNYTDYFANGFMTTVERKLHYDNVHVLEHLYDLHSYKHKHKEEADHLEVVTYTDRTYLDIKSLHQCDDLECPFQYVHPYFEPHKERYREIIERSTTIRQAMDFLTNLVVDWSSRVWVISEFHISKKKNNLKILFTQLAPGGFETASFLNFGMNGPLKAIQNRTTRTSNAVYLNFHQQLIDQLNRQTFLEMMLKSKASKNEDRFYSIFPLFPQYKQLLQTNIDLTNNVSSILAVKLKLYKVMTNQHKLLLLFLSLIGEKTWSLPTFATSTIHWPQRYDYDEMTSKPFLHEYKLTLSPTMDYLVLRTPGFYISRNIIYVEDEPLRALDQLLPNTFCQGGAPLVDAVWLFHEKTCLVGSFRKNTWVIGTPQYCKNRSYISKSFDFYIY